MQRSSASRGGRTQRMRRKSATLRWREFTGCKGHVCHQKSGSGEDSRASWAAASIALSIFCSKVCVAGPHALSRHARHVRLKDVKYNSYPFDTDKDGRDTRSMFVMSLLVQVCDSLMSKTILKKRQQKNLKHGTTGLEAGKRPADAAPRAHFTSSLLIGRTAETADIIPCTCNCVRVSCSCKTFARVRAAKLQ